MIIMPKGCLVALPIPSAHANASIMFIYIPKRSAIWRRKVESLSREVPLIANTSSQLLVWKLGLKLKRLRRQSRSKFFHKNPLMHHALIRIGQPPTFFAIFMSSLTDFLGAFKGLQNQMVDLFGQFNTNNFCVYVNWQNFAHTWILILAIRNIFRYTGHQTYDRWWEVNFFSKFQVQALMAWD